MCRSASEAETRRNVKTKVTPGPVKQGEAGGGGGGGGGDAAGDGARSLGTLAYIILLVIRMRRSMVCKQNKGAAVAPVQIEMPLLDWRRCAQLGPQKSLSPTHAW